MSPGSSLHGGHLKRGSEMEPAPHCAPPFPITLWQFVQGQRGRGLGCRADSPLRAARPLPMCHSSDAKMECLNLTMREVVKRQNSKTKKNFNQISVSQIKVDKAQIIAQHGCTFPLCLDQDERKILQRVIK
ncbi:hypothetical protein FKM82_022766 [Ascaphus truei]